MESALTEKLSEKLQREMLEPHPKFGITGAGFLVDKERLIREVEALEAEIAQLHRERKALDVNYKELWGENQRLLREIEDWKKAMAAEMGFNE